VVLAAFQTTLHRKLLKLTDAKPAGLWVADGRAPLAHGEIGGMPVSVALLPVGAPWTVVLCEQMIVCGAKAIIVAGAAGSLQEAAKVGAFAVPTSALREEGTSYHYAPASLEATPSPDLAAALVERCRARGIEPFTGTNWTTDAPFRETRGKVERYSARGILSVDMEASAMFVLGALRGVEVASLFIISDELFHPWKPAFSDPFYRERLELAAEVAVDVGGRWAERYPRGGVMGVAPAPE
jgi:uridine phosphorylase